MKLRRCHIPFLSTILHNVNQDIIELGIHKTFNNIVKLRKCKIIVKGLSPQLKKILKSERVIFISNHPHIIEPFIYVSTLPPRKDFYIVMNAKFLNWLSNLNPHIIPVHIQHHYQKENHLGLRARIFNLLPLSIKSIDQQRAHELNINNMEKASNLLDQGAMIIIFPGDENIHWFSGVGHLTKKTHTKKPIYMVRAYMHRTNKFDLLRMIPGFGVFFPPIFIEFAPIVKINHLRKFDGKKIAQIMETDYRTWKTSLNH